jgi:hypothetical protein
MHPPRFSFDQRLSDWPACYLELTCCKGYTVTPVGLLLKKHGDRTFNDLLQRLCCDTCGSHPAPVYLCASHSRTGNTHAVMADWAVELVSPPSNAAVLAGRRRTVDETEDTGDKLAAEG